MKRPSFQFYPADWSTDLALRRCSPAARGVWMDVLCALHNSDDQYGVLRWKLKEIANTIGASMAHVRELVDKGVLKGSDVAIDAPLIYTPRHGRKDGEPVTLIGKQAGPLWYSKRMVKDEYVRTIRGASTRFGDDDIQPPNTPPKPAPMPPFGDGTSSSSSSSSSNTERSVCVDPPAHTHISPDFQAEARTARPDLTDLQPVYQDFVAHYGSTGATINRWRKWLLRERKAGSEPTSAAAGTNGHDPDSRASIEATGQALGLGKWDELEQFSTYKARVRAAQWQARAPTAKGVQ